LKIHGTRWASKSMNSSIALRSDGQASIPFALLRKEKRRIQAHYAFGCSSNLGLCLSRMPRLPVKAARKSSPTPTSPTLKLLSGSPSAGLFSPPVTLVETCKVIPTETAVEHGDEQSRK